jgi:hypothetical protein
MLQASIDVTKVHTPKHIFAERKLLAGSFGVNISPLSIA